MDTIFKKIVNTPEVAEICGIHAGDGYLRDDGKRRELEISGGFDEKSYYDKHVIPLFNKTFNLNIKGRYFYSKSTYGFVIRYPEINVIRFIHDLGFPYGKKSLSVKIPKFVLENDLLKRHFLRGYFDTDGHLSFTKRANGSYSEFKKTRHYYPRITLTTVSKNLAKEVRIILKELDFTFSHYKNEPRGPNYSLQYKVDINGVNNIRKWMKIIGSKNYSKYSRFLVWKKHGFCPTNITYEQRRKILKGEINPNLLY